MQWFNRLLMWLVGLTLLAGCAVNPVTGQQELMLMSEQDERQMGIQTDKSVIEQYGIYADGNLQSYIQSIGMPMAKTSHRPDLPWQFRVMDSPVVNAFAAPGGYVYITRGLLAATNNEAELAGVLGHEIGHVTARHSAQQYSKIMLANLGLGVGVSLSGQYGKALEPLLQTGTGLLFLKFSRDDERESDVLGVEYASKAGYDAGQMASFFETLQAMRTLDDGGGDQLPEFLSTHPNPTNREPAVRRMATEWQARLPGQTYRINRDGYLDHIDGLVYGDDPRKGYREDDWYYLPNDRVQYQIPAQWRFTRQGSQAQMVRPDKRALVLFDIEENHSLDQVIVAFINAMQAKVVQSSMTSAPGMTGKQLISVIEDGKQRAVMLSSFFAKGNNVFMFHGLCGEQDFSSMRALLGQPAASFGPITDQTKLDRQPQRIHIKSVNRSSSLQEALHGFQVESELWDKVAWLNNMKLTDRLTNGQRIKIVK
jgi:predicted Zn-dependent protease